MRIQLNKTCIEEIDYRKFFSKQPHFLSFAHPTVGNAIREHRYQYSDVFFAFLCPQCGAELFAHWAIPKYRINCDNYTVRDKMDKYFHQRNFEGLTELMEKSPYFHRIKYSKSVFDEICDTIQKIDSKQRVARSEASEIFMRTKKCPCCSTSLSRSEGHFSVVNADNGFLHFNKNLDAELIGFYRNLENYDISSKNRKVYGRNDFYDCDALFDAMKRVRHSMDQENATVLLDGTLSQYETAASAALPIPSSTIKNDPEQLKMYLLNLIQTETNILSLTQRLHTLYTQRPDVNRNAYGSTLQTLWDACKQVQDAANALKTCQANLAAIEAKKLIPPHLPMPQQPRKPTEPVYETPVFFNKKRIVAQNEALKREYEEKLVKYENEANQYTQALEARQQKITKLTQEQIEQHRKDIEFERACVTDAEIALTAAQQKQSSIENTASDFASPEKAYKLLLDKEISQAEELLQKAILCKYQLYSANIVFSKYRDLVALSTFYEYLLSGRCDTLEGTNGAYNLYESESRANVIIAQLHNVLESLEAIKENQYMIYDAIQNTNASLRRLESTMNVAAKSLKAIEAKAETMTQYMARIADNSDVIAHNSAVTAYYSKINAELTNALGFMVTLS